MNIVIKSSKELKNNYKNISKECKDTGNPIFITVNGRNDTVIMSYQAYNQMIDRQETSKRLALVRKDRRNGVKGFTISESREIMQKTIEGETIENGQPSID